MPGGTTNYSQGIIQTSGTKWQKQFIKYQHDNPKRHLAEYLQPGEVAQLTEEMLLEDKDIETTLFLRNASRLAKDKDKATIIDGDATNKDDLAKAIKGQDTVYSNLASTSTIDKQAQAVIEVMDKLSVSRLIWISTLRDS